MVQIGCCLPGGIFAPEEGTKNRKYHEIVNTYNFIKNCGFDYVEMSVGTALSLDEDDLSLLKNDVKNGLLSFYSTNGFIAEDINVVGENISYDRIEEYAERVFSEIAPLGVKRSVFGSGGKRRIPEGFSTEKANEQFFNSVKTVGKIASEYGILLCVEPLNKDETNMINTVSEGFKLVKEINMPNVGLVADLFHMSRENEPIEILSTARDYIFHFHAAEPGDRKYPGAHGNEYLLKAAEIMKNIGYDGGITAEAGFTDFKKDCPACREFMEKIYK